LELLFIGKKFLDKLKLLILLAVSFHSLLSLPLSATSGEKTRSESNVLVKIGHQEQHRMCLISKDKCINPTLLRRRMINPIEDKNRK
jgi:hypothetical protein